jgi:hypothetical protein
VNGAHQDPMAIAKSSETLTIAPAARAKFAQLAQGFRGQLDVAPTIAASARYSE